MLLLDTCAAIWLANGDPLTPASRSAVRNASAEGALLVSPVSAWEVGMLSAKAGPAVTFLDGPEAWFARLLTLPGVRLVPLTPHAAIASSLLPGRLHGDPADRLLLATARETGATLVTRDRKILAYARQGHVKALRC